MAASVASIARAASYLAVTSLLAIGACGDEEIFDGDACRDFDSPNPNTCGRDPQLRTLNGHGFENWNGLRVVSALPTGLFAPTMDESIVVNGSFMLDLGVGFCGEISLAYRIDSADNGRCDDDAITHARVGWAHLASPWITRPIRKEIARRLVALIRVNVAQWLESSTLTGLSVPEHGLPESSEQREHVLGAVSNVVIPGFDHVGIDVSAAQRWFDAEFG